MLKSKYLKLVPKLQAELKLKSISAVPRVAKVVVNVGVGRAVQDPKLLEFVVSELKRITGQAPVVTKAKQSVAGFKLREGAEIGAMVTLRGDRMYDFLERLVGVALPRVRDFQGLETKFDGHGNYTLGLKEHVSFPEVVFENADKVFGMEITIVTTAASDLAARALLTTLGFPFKKQAATS
ncbi:MAG: 50S ribosomal protein L5 [bacterium]